VKMMRCSMFAVVTAMTCFVVTMECSLMIAAFTTNVGNNNMLVSSSTAFVIHTKSSSSSSSSGDLVFVPSSRVSNTAVYMAAGKKKRRRRKNPPSSSTETTEEVSKKDDSSTVEDMQETASTQLELNAKFDFTPNAMVVDDDDDDEFEEEADKQFILPDIRTVLQRKEEKKMEEEMIEEKVDTKKRISRKDTDAFIKLMESEPFGDADPKNFEEEYDTVSALLGEGSKSFIGIPAGPLQVGHFVGAIVIVLMAFVEYPGFPLTNLPSPVRGFLQGGLGTVYAVNVVMSIAATFQASERGQSKFLWAMKSFAVGGLAFDQLNQLPTLKEVEELKNRKGKRALKNMKKKKG